LSKFSLLTISCFSIKGKAFFFRLDKIMVGGRLNVPKIKGKQQRVEVKLNSDAFKTRRC